MAAQPPGREYVLYFADMACRVMGNRRNTNATIRRRSTDTLLQRDAGRTARDDPPPRQERRWALHEWLDSRSVLVYSSAARPGNATISSSRATPTRGGGQSSTSPVARPQRHALTSPQPDAISGGIRNRRE